MLRTRPRFAIENRKEKSPGELAEGKIAPGEEGREGTGAKPSDQGSALIRKG